MWTYKCKAGLYKSDNLALLLIAIVSHRFTHFLKGEGFVDRINRKQKVRHGNEM